MFNNKKIMVNHLTKESFLDRIFDYEKNKEWKYEGEKPAIIDFYADWCGPCKIVSPVLDELSDELNEKMDFYKIDTEAEQELAAIFGIRSIPSFLFIPVNAQPQMAVGALPKETFVRAIKDVLGVEKETVGQK
jgi:thioredoxin